MIPLDINIIFINSVAGFDFLIICFLTDLWTFCEGNKNQNCASFDFRNQCIIWHNYFKFSKILIDDMSGY